MNLVFPHVAAPVAGVRTPATVKAQYLLATIDKAGRQLGHVAPKYPLNLDKATTPGRTAPHWGSPNSAGNGNAYSRSLPERMSADGGFELDNPRDYHMDVVLECKLRLWRGGDPM